MLFTILISGYEMSDNLNSNLWTLDNLLKFSKSQISHRKNSDNESVYLKVQYNIKY